MIAFLIALLLSSSSQANSSVKVGIICPKSSKDMKTEALQSIEAMRLAIKNQGTLLGRDIELEIIDTHGEPMNAPANVDQIRRNGIVGVVGLMGGEEDIRVARLLNSNRIPTVAEASTDPYINKPFKNQKSYIFQTSVDDRVQADSLAKKLSSLGKTRIVMVLDPLERSPLIFSTEFKKSFQKLNGTVIEHRIAENSLSDTAELISAEDYQADGVLIIGKTQDTISLYVALRKHEVMLDIITADSIISSDISIPIGKLGKRFNIFLFTAHFNSLHTPTKTKDFITSFNSKNPEIPLSEYSLDALLTYDSATILFKAIEKAHSFDPDKIRESLTRVSINGLTGPLSYKDDGKTNRKISFLKIKGGTLETAE